MSNEFEVAETILNTKYGKFDFACFSWGGHEEDNILCLRNPLASTQPHLVRVQSACYTAEIFRSTDCDCHEQLDESLCRIQREGGILVYMLCDGRGAGLLVKTRGLELGRAQGLDTSDAYRQLGVRQDPREYSRVADVLRYYQVGQLRLLTNNPRKVEGLERCGFDVERVPLEIPATDASRDYLRTKALKMDHMLQQFDSHS